MSNKRKISKSKDFSESFKSYKESSSKSCNSNSILGINFSDNPEQKELIRLMNQNDIPIIFCLGDAGTGKTFTAVAAAINLVRIQKKYSKIFYIREPLEVGKSLGFLPGDIDDKYGVYLDGLEDNIEHISKFSGISRNDMRECIECVPPQYTRGRSWENCIILVDECENLSLDTIQTLSTRIGKYCKMVFLGSMNQIDIRGKTKDSNDLILAMNIFDSIVPTISAKVKLIKSERSECCHIIDEAFSKYKENKSNKNISTIEVVPTITDIARKVLQ